MGCMSTGRLSDPPLSSSASAAGGRRRAGARRRGHPLDRPGLRRALEERAERRAARVGEQHLRSEPRQQREQLVDVSPLVEEVGAEDEIPRAARRRRVRPREPRGRESSPRSAPRSAPRRASASSDQSVASTSAPRSAATTLGSPRPQPSSSTRNARRASDAATTRAERDRARPQLGPVRQELLALERLLADQLLGVGRVKDGELEPADLDARLDSGLAVLLRRALLAALLLERLLRDLLLQLLRLVGALHVLTSRRPYSDPRSSADRGLDQLRRRDLGVGVLGDPGSSSQSISSALAVRRRASRGARRTAARRLPGRRRPGSPNPRHPGRRRWFVAPSRRVSRTKNVGAPWLAARSSPAGRSAGAQDALTPFASSSKTAGGASPHRGDRPSAMPP